MRKYKRREGRRFRRPHKSTVKKMECLLKKGFSVRSVAAAFEYSYGRVRDMAKDLGIRGKGRKFDWNKYVAEKFDWEEFD